VEKKRLSKTLRITFLIIGVLFIVSLAVRIYNSRRFHLEEEAYLQGN
jgi:hypothetical protein